MKEEKKILRPKKIKTTILLLISTLFVIIGFIAVDKNPFLKWGGIAFFGLGVVVFVIQLLPNSTYLKLTSERFEVCSLYRSHFTKWTDVKTFRIGYIRYTKMVMFNYTEEHKNHNSGKKIAKFLSANQGALPNTYGMSAKQLAKLMNEWKSKN